MTSSYLNVMHDVICVNLYHSKSWLNPPKKVNSVPSPLLLPLHNHGNKLFLPSAVTRKIMLGENNVTSASLHKKCIWLNSRLLNLSIQRKKDLSFLEHIILPKKDIRSAVAGWFLSCRQKWHGVSRLKKYKRIQRFQQKMFS